MLYELIAVVRPGKIAEVKDIAKVTGSLILSHNGVIRSIANWGTFLLTKPVKKHQAWHAEGQHFLMRFDSSVQTQEAVRKLLGLDPRMIRFGITKMGDRQGTLASTANVREVVWSRFPTDGRRPGEFRDYVGGYR